MATTSARRVGRTRSRPRSIGLWLAPDRSDESPTRQIRSLIRQLEHLEVDTLLFPEAWLADEDLHVGADDSDDVLRAAVVDFLAKHGLRDRRCMVGLSVFEDERGWGEFLIDTGGGPSYQKHTSAGRVAFEEESWDPRRNLPQWPGSIGPTICHDVYLSLLQHFHAARGCKVLVNPSGRNVQSRKWLALHAARSIENGAFMACTMSNAKGRVGKPIAFVTGPAGRLLELTSVIGASALGDRPGTLYSCDLRTDANQAIPVPTSRRSTTGLPIQIRGDRVVLGPRSTSWGEASNVGGFRVVPVDNDAVRDPCAFVRPFVEEAGACLFWVRVPFDSVDEAMVIGLARAIEFSSAVLVEPDQGAPFVVELHNLSKGTRVVSPPCVDPRWQKGYESAFKMARGYGESRGAWRESVPLYERLLNCCRS